MMKKILHIAKWVLLIGYIIAMLGFAAKKSNRLICKEVKIIVNQPHKFITNETVENLLITNKIKLDSCIIDKVNFDLIENIVESNPLVHSVQAYSDFYGRIFIVVKQRNPIMRIITENNESYYIDEECKLMPTSLDYTAHVVVVSGVINDTLLNTLNNKPSTSTIGYNYSFTMYDLYEFVNFINQDDLWKNQIEQIYVNEDKEIELVPRVGNHIIILGNLKDYVYKLGKLEALYKKGFTLTDWNIYSSINLKYSNQVICKKR